MSFQKAVRGTRPVKVLISGAAGGGKTKSALRLMKGFIGDKPLLVADTENNSSTIYANEFDFLIHNMEEKDQTIKGYIEVMDKAKTDGNIKGLILDGITPAWKYILELSNKMEGSNSYTNWAKLTPMYENFKKAIINFNLPLICTVRSKQDYVLEQNEKGRLTPKKVGLAMEAGKDIDFDFDIVFAVDQSTNMARIDKCRYSEVVEYFKDKGGEVLLTEEVGAIIKKAIKGE